MKKRTRIILVLVGVMLVIGTVYYLNFKSSPAYSLLQIKYALEDHNYAEFQKYVDVDGMMSSVVDQIFEILQGDSGPFDKMGASFSYFGAGLMNMIKPQLTLMYKPQVQKWVESGKFETESPFGGNTIYPLPDLWKRAGAVSITGIEYEKREGDKALIGIGIKDVNFDTLLIIQIKMRAKGNYWQVAEVLNLAKFEKAMETLEQKRIDKINAPIIKKMQTTLQVINIDRIKSTTKNVKMLVEIKNNGSKTISEYAVAIHLSDIHHFRNKEISINTATCNHLPENLGSQKTATLTWPTDGTTYHDPWLADTPTQEFIFNLSVESIQFTDGTSLQLHHKWQ